MPPQSNYNTRKIVLLGVILLVIAGIIGFFAIRQHNKTVQETQTKNLFPFGSGTGTPITGSTTGTQGEAISNPIPQNPLSAANTDRLRVIANYPVTAFYPSIQNRVSTEPQQDPKTGNTVLVSTSTPTNVVRFNAKQNGFLADADIVPDSIVISQKTDTEIPGAQELWFANKGNTAIFRSWNSDSRKIDSFDGSLPNQTPLGYCQKPFTSLLTTRSTGNDVKEFQKYLNAKMSLSLSVDGKFGRKAVAALKPLQKILGIKETGAYDAATRDAINNDCLGILGDFQRKASGIQKLTGDFIDTGILRGTVSPDGTKLFYLKPTTAGVVGLVTNSDGSSAKQIFSSPLTEWKPQWINADTIAMTTLGSYQADGYLYFLTVSTGNFKKILGPVRGLTTNTNASGTMVLVGQSTPKGLRLSILSTASGVVTPLDLQTLPAKCVWKDDTTAACGVPQGIPDGQYPDDWYQGNVSFNDSFWLIDGTEGKTVNLFSPKQDFDSENLSFGPDGAYLYFMNRLDGTLWSYRMSDN